MSHAWLRILGRNVIVIKPSRSGSENIKEICQLTDHKKQPTAGEVLFLQNLPHHILFFKLLYNTLQPLNHAIDFRKKAEEIFLLCGQHD